MLSRHAEDLFWIGRYLERAEDTARALDTTREAAISTIGDEADPWHELLEILYLDPGLLADGTGSVVRYLVSDRTNANSIASSVAHARDNARGVREWLSIELWEAINDFHLELLSRDLDANLRNDPYDFFQLIRRRSQGVIGVAIATMPRTEGFRFFAMGQSLLERASITARLLAVWYRRLAGMGGTAGFVEWTKVLKSVSAYEAYLREHRAEMDADRVLLHLLSSAEMPRSVLFCLRGVERQLQVVAGGGGGYGQASLREAGRVRSRVEFVDPAALRGPALQEFLAGVEAGINAIGVRVEQDFFGHTDLSIHSYQAF